MESEFGKPYQGKPQGGKFIGNPGIVDSETLGLCAMSIINIVVANHSHLRHVSTSLKDRAMREEVLASLSDSIRPSVAAFPKTGSWLGLLQHFLQTCGPKNIRAAVHAMLDEAKMETPVRTLRQRITTLVLSWYVSQDTFYRVHPEFDDYGEVLLPCACSPFVAVHDQLEATRELIQNSAPAL